MNQDSKSLIQRSSVFVLLAIATCALLLVPLIAMRYTSAVNWGLADFVVMGALLFGTASAYVFAARRLSARNRVFVGGLLAAGALYIWAELAVGVFTNLGS